MTKEELKEIIQLGEQTNSQFKERLHKDNKYDVGCEMVALSNSNGGTIYIGINDKTGDINPLSYSEVQETTMLLGNMSSENVVPPILIEIQNILVDGGTVVSAIIKQGVNKPYHDNKGIVWVKNGADKRKVFDNVELMTMLASAGQIFPDRIPVKETTVEDLDDDTIRKYLLRRFDIAYANLGIDAEETGKLTLKSLIQKLVGKASLEQLLRNWGLVRADGELTVAALMLFGRNPQKYMPAYTVRCISFVGNSVGSTSFRDKSDALADGNLLHIYQYIMSFLLRNLKRIQTENEFNSSGSLEIPVVALTEVVVNALVHRSYALGAPVRVFVFDNRVEIHSPGCLPNGISVDSIKNGVSFPVNELLFGHAIYLLPYTGAGSGITRALSQKSRMIFTNDTLTNEFVVTFERITNIGTNIGTNIDNSVNTRGNEQNITNNGGDEDTTTNNDIDSSNIPRVELNNEQKNILKFCSVPRTQREILNHIGLTYQTYNINKFIKPLVVAGLIEPTMIKIGKGKSQKYRRKMRN